MRRIALICLVSLVWLASPAVVRGFDDLRVRLLKEDTLAPLEDLSVGHRLDRIDSLEADLGALSPAEQAVRIEQIGRLYASSSLIKHQVWALEMLQEEIKDAVPTLDALLARALTYDRLWNPRQSVKAFELLTRAYPHSARAQREAGRALLDHGLHNLDDEFLDRSLRCFRKAVACRDATSADWIGLASALVANQRFEELKGVGDELLARGDVSPAAELYAALGHHAVGMPAESERLFRVAAGMMEPQSRYWFLGGEQFFEQYRPVLEDEPLSSLAPPPGTLLWWVRLAETEVLFSNPDIGLHGWFTIPGRIFMRYGRPRRMAYYPAGMKPSIDEVMITQGLDRIHDALAREIVRLKQFEGHWLWIYRFNGQDFPIFFKKYNELARWWKPTGFSASRIIPLQRELPFTLSPREPKSDMVLDVRHAAFRTPDDHVRAEAYFALRRASQTATRGLADSFRVAITIQHPEGEVVDQVERILDQTHQRGALLRDVNGRRSEDETVIGQLGVDLRPGRYVIRMEAEDMATGAYRAHDRMFELQPRSDGLAISDVELCDSFTDYDISMGLPDPFVKYARAIVPHPERRLDPSWESVFVYYEVYGAEVDSTGSTHLDVIYEVFDARGFSPFNAGHPPGQEVGPRPLVRAVFSDERTGLSWAGAVVKGTEIDIKELEPGDYVVAVSVNDRLGRDEAQRFVRFSR